jgi:hypothetical protein
VYFIGQMLQSLVSGMPEKNGDNMNKNMALVSSCLLLFSTQLLADRPAVSEQNTGPAMQESTAQESAAHAEAQSPLEEAQVKETAAPAKLLDEAPSTASTTQTGDVLELQSGETLPVRVLDFPHRGMSMDNVQKELGEPLEISPTIGDPPITSWSYNDRTVYFEHSRVIHAVSNH